MLSTPEYETAWGKFFFRAIDELGRGQDPLLSLFHFDRTTHVDTVQHVNADQGTTRMPPMEVIGFSSIHKQEIEATNLPAIIGWIRDGAKSTLASLKPQFIQRMATILDEAGRTFSAGNKPLSGHLILDGFEKTDLDFNEDGSPNLPVVFFPPDRVFRIDELPFSQEERKRFEAIVERKREVFLAEKRSRRIP